jgi:putative inorganic carbon (hco3(-)) transporter
MAYRDTTIIASRGWGEDPVLVPTRNLAAEAAVLVFFFIFYANLATVVTRFHGVPQIVASGVAALLFIPLAKYVVLERQPLVVTPVLVLVFAFLGALFLSAALSEDPNVSRDPVVGYLTEGLVLYLLVSNAVRTTSVLRQVMWVLILAGSFMGAFSIVQELTHTYSNEYGGLAQIDRLDTGGGFNIAAEDAPEKVLRPRLGGPFGSENRYAQIMAAVLPLALLQAFRGRKRSHRLAAGAGMLLIAGGICLSFSRGAAVAVVATLAAMVLLRELRVRHALALFTLLAALVVLAVPDYITRLSSLRGVTALSSTDSSGEQQPDSSIVGRQTENLAAWNSFLDHPVIGVGPGVYFKEYSRDYGNRLGLKYLQSERRGHSLYLELAADTGMIGLGAFLAMVGTALVLLYRAAKEWRPRDPDRALLASSFFFALFAYLVSGVFLHLSYQRYFWVLLALASSVIWALRQDGEDEADRAAVVSPA